ncbi:MAG: hypothetical protein ACRDPK_04740, partial [Carbonactinosporaceae bacterium]
LAPLGPGTAAGAGAGGQVWALRAALYAVPLFAVVALCTRAEVNARGGWLATRLAAGGTPGQVRRLLAGETAVAAFIGAVGATGIATLAGHPPPTPLAAAAAVPLTSLLAGVTAGVVVTPGALGARTRRPPGPPLPWGLPLLVMALVAPSVLGGWTYLAFIAGVPLSASWLAARAGTLAARRARGAAMLLAGRLLENDSRGRGLALAPVAVAVALTAGAGTVPVASPLLRIGSGVALGCAACALLALAYQTVATNRQSLATLSAFGTPRSQLWPPVLLLSVLPPLAVGLAAGIGGLLATLRLVGPSVSTAATVMGRAAASTLLVTATCVTLSSLALLALRRATHPVVLRAE